jgi:Uma2 family endonuclease
MVIAAKKKLFTVDEYYEMARVGILTESDRVELIEGEIVEMSPIGSRHQAIVDELTYVFSNAVGARARVRVQGPLRLADITEPQPDVQLLVPRDDRYVGGHPTQLEALLVVEVSDTSLSYDRNYKSVIYSMRGVPELWILDVGRPRLFVMREPAEMGYRVVMELEVGDAIAPVALPDLSFAVADLLSPLL